MIRNLISTSRNGEVADVLDSTISAYNRSTLITDPYLVMIFSELQPKSTLMIKAINSNNTESGLEGADIFRDGRVRGLFFGVKSALYNDIPAIKTAAQKIDKILDNYGLEMTKESYAEESTMVKSLLSELSGPSLADAIAAIPGCVDAIAQLQEAQDAFTAISDAFEKAKSSDKQQLNATQLKKDVVNYINQKLVRYLNGMQAVNDTEYGEVANHVAQIIADNNSRVKRRSNNGHDTDQSEE